MASSNSSRLTFFVGVNTGYVADDRPDERLIEFYRRRASPRLHCAIVGNVVIPSGYGSNARTPHISSDRVWRDVASAIAEQGTLPGIQLSTAWKDYQGSVSFRSRDSGQAIASARRLVDAMEAAEISAILGALEAATDLALDAGFRHIQVHAAHGYLFSLLVDPRIYRQADGILTRLGDWASRLAANKVESSIRISLRTGDNAFDAMGRDEFHQNIATTPFDFIDVSSGFYNIDKQLIYPSRPDIIERRRLETVRLASLFPSKRFIYSGRAFAHSEVELPSNLHFGICRDLIANPAFLENPAMGCINSGKCHYFSRGEEHITCSQW